MKGIPWERNSMVCNYDFLCSKNQKHKDTAPQVCCWCYDHLPALNVLFGHRNAVSCGHIPYIHMIEHEVGNHWPELPTQEPPKCIHRLALCMAWQWRTDDNRREKGAEFPPGVQYKIIIGQIDGMKQLVLFVVPCIKTSQKRYWRPGGIWFRCQNLQNRTLRFYT